MTSTLLPASPEAERDALGAALHDPEALVILLERTDPEMFVSEDHRALRRILGELAAAGRPVDPTIVLAELRHRGEFSQLRDLLEACTTSGVPARSEVYCDLVAESAARRDLIRFGQRLGARALEEDPRSLRTEALEYLAKDDQPLGARPDLLEVADLAEVAAAIDAAPPVGFLAEPVWPTDAYGVFGAEDKAGKSWAALDLAVSVAAGGEWLDRFPVREPGIVLVLYGEGGKRRLVRRLRAIARWKNVALDDLPIRVAPRVPHLTASGDLDALRREVETCPPKLIILDPLYLAARGARGSDLYEMGEHLENVQRIAEGVGSALLVVTHFNKTGEGRGPKRFTGAGPGAWGRVLVTADVVGRHTEEDTTATVVTLDLAFTGDEIPDTNLRIRRRVWAEDPSDLASPLRYELEEATGERSTPDGLTPAAARVLAILERADEPRLVSERLEQMRSQLRANAYARMIENRFVTSESDFIDADMWDACVDPQLRPVVSDDKMRLWVGVDASTKRDATAIVGCTWDPKAKRVRVAFHRIFRPSKRDPLDFEATVERTLLDLKERFLLRKVLYDPYQLVAVAQRLERAGLPMEELPQTSGNLTEATGNLYELIKGRNLQAYPSDELRLAILRAVAVESGRGLRLSKTKTSHHIDAAVALSFAALGAAKTGSSEPDEYRIDVIEIGGGPEPGDLDGPLSRTQWASLWRSERPTDPWTAHEQQQAASASAAPSQERFDGPVSK